MPTARFAVREVSSAGRGGTSFTVTGPAASTARAIVLTARGRKLLVGWSTPAGSLVGRMWDTSHGVPWARSDDPKAVVKEAMAAGFAGRMAMAPVGPDPHPSFIDGRRTYELAVSTGGIHVATGGAFGTVTVRDTGTDRDPGAVIPAPSAVAGCAACARITALAFVPDGSTLAVAYGSGALRLWDLRTNRLLGDSPATSGDVIDSLAFGSDGYLYAAGPHVSVQAYPVGPAQVAARLCVRAGRRSLTVAEWRRYLPGMSYRPLCDGPRPDDGSAQSATEAGPGLVEPARTPSPPSPAVAVLPGAADEAKPTPAPDPRPRAEHRTGGNRAGSGENQRTKKRAEGNPPTPRTMPAPARKHR
ncbi:WD-40 repeat-containing serine/threonine protein kinase [Streptomyces sviceus ATCC 29083]|uniref:WD-40 repeat-containing serine/threonine protein kinase n=1 Tax=Streptomyces sviceus (strain ATCC 29083 / DSM 924 / JCM 4929 / NBRC 13980 / NCIMB 11184 / NRRL 5439 / UC 5370) TaxID=463191 RepID=B5I6Y7_STRX2|nr:WD-40 repeat-containing serine/threonine protein kinase [Streptomyces sviceus ATCC 29083]